MRAQAVTAGYATYLFPTKQMAMINHVVKVHIIAASHFTHRSVLRQ